VVSYKGKGENKTTPITPPTFSIARFIFESHRTVLRSKLDEKSEQLEQKGKRRKKKRAK
jgi:hypothetical protein